MVAIVSIYGIICDVGFRTADIPFGVGYGCRCGAEEQERFGEFASRVEWGGGGGGGR